MDLNREGLSDNMKERISNTFFRNAGSSVSKSNISGLSLSAILILICLLSLVGILS